jgi:cyclic pyranopterin phosphate synthase
MIDISDKLAVRRVASAKGEIKLKPETIAQIRQGKIKKGDVLSVARVAGINAVKNTPSIIPLCHPIPIDFIGIDFEVGENSVVCSCQVKADYKTGVEMEALVGTATTLLAIWDMVKYLEKDERGQYPQTRIINIEVVEKTKEVVTTHPRHSEPKAKNLQLALDPSLRSG